MMFFFKTSFKTKITLIIFICIGFNACKKEKEVSSKIVSIEENKNTLFSLISSNESGIDFVNTLEETLESNYYQYLYTYIGGGIAAGDINNDGLVDLYFTSNQAEDKLYLNKGNFKFEDITQKSGIKNIKGFNTGVTMVDINNDGFLDICVSRGGWLDDNDKFSNLLYINNGDSTFTEKAKELGLDDNNRTIHATFFDYDNDNDLDVYISNSPDITGKSKIQNLSISQNNSKNLELKGCDKLYNNDGTGHFTDVSRKANLHFDIGFGLNPQVSDLNNDGWLDIYVCNDFDYPDLAYINNGNGTFTESRDTLFKHMSYNSMGSDFVDINNDGLFDLITLDMNPEDYIRSKTTMAMTPLSKFESMVDNGYHYQYMHNMLQVNNGNGTFSEIANMSGIANTDWSWSILSADFDLDGLNDLYISNGVYRDVNDRDKLNEALSILRANQRKPTKEDFLQFTQLFTQQKLSNYFYKNNGDLTFKNVSKTWSNEPKTFSNGATYADLDNDGDLDIVVNNINDVATVLKNNARTNKKNNYLKVKFIGPKKNPFGLGTTVEIQFKNGTKQKRQLINTRGFLSSVSNTLHFGIANNDVIEKIEVIWLDGKRQILHDISSNQLLKIDYNNGVVTSKKNSKNNTSKALFSKVTSNFKHIDPYFNDYKYQVLLPHKLSQTGPSIAKSDVNNDGIDDLFIGGANGHVGQLLIGNKSGNFNVQNTKTFFLDKKYEDVGATFFDADNDGDQDLYVISGSYEYYEYPTAYQDRLYLNDGHGIFTKSIGILPEITSAGSVAKPCDYDNDGDIDLFIGGRVVPGKYPYAPTSYLLQNNNGKFSNIIKNRAPELEHIGMITDAVWVDIDNNESLDLVVTGEWMGIEIFINKGHEFIKSDSYKNLSKTKGWWNKLLIADIDNDGDSDIIAGNLGLNSKFHASIEKPFHIYTNDFDFNGVEDIVMAKDYKGKQVPIRGKTCMTQQMPHLAQKIPTYSEFANKDLKGILGKRLQASLHYEATEFRSGIFINNEAQGYTFKPFNMHVQQSPINSIVYYDFDGDSIKDLVLAGNNHMSEVETTKSDAGIGVFMKGNETSGFNYIPNIESGLFIDKDVRDMTTVEANENTFLFISNNNNTHDLFKVNKK